MTLLNDTNSPEGIETSAERGAGVSTAPEIFVIHENPEWIPPFAAAFARAGQPFREWLLTDGSIDLDREPPEGVFWSRLSASSHSRGHEHAKEYGRAVLAWLESYGRRVINGSSVLEFEVSKVRQYLALARAGFRVPQTVAVFDRGDLSARAAQLQTPFITKHNQGGKGLGVRRFDSHAEFASYIASEEYEEPVDGITLLQEYVRSAEPFITRAEFIGGRFHYAVRVDTSAGSFELCPADACEIPSQSTAEELPALAGAACDVPAAPGAFTVRPEITASHPLIEQLTRFLDDNGIEVAGVEFIETADGDLVVYDINTNTNYNSAVELTVHTPAADRLVEFLTAAAVTQRHVSRAHA
ncbi:ATP-grasp domain-containing protein [Pseudoclavibacter sp. CFCC 14310]|uniref:ATP-grasp domain-containing protein n=1 Tax=Pseudoclavibacter sp. CFCC 14310 TaxID=2615180 RepID=UPI001CE401BD|nr:alpha-L-glutamate ligase [Pseudoclavibacter sp. CFCC 14310]